MLVCHGVDAKCSPESCPDASFGGTSLPAGISDGPNPVLRVVPQNGGGIRNRPGMDIWGWADDDDDSRRPSFDDDPTGSAAVGGGFPARLKAAARFPGSGDGRTSSSSISSRSSMAWNRPGILGVFLFFCRQEVSQGVIQRESREGGREGGASYGRVACLLVLREDVRWREEEEKRWRYREMRLMGACHVDWCMR